MMSVVLTGLRLPKAGRFCHRSRKQEPLARAAGTTSFLSIIAPTPNPDRFHPLIPARFTPSLVASRMARKQGPTKRTRPHIDGSIRLPTPTSQHLRQTVLPAVGRIHCRVSHLLRPGRPRLNSLATLAGGTVVHKREIAPPFTGGASGPA